MRVVQEEPKQRELGAQIEHPRPRDAATGKCGAAAVDEDTERGEALGYVKERTARCKTCRICGAMRPINAKS